MVKVGSGLRLIDLETVVILTLTDIQGDTNACALAS